MSYDSLFSVTDTSISVSIVHVQVCDRITWDRIYNPPYCPTVYMTLHIPFFILILENGRGDKVWDSSNIKDSLSFQATYCWFNCQPFPSILIHCCLSVKCHLFKTASIFSNNCIDKREYCHVQYVWIERDYWCYKTHIINKYST